MNASENDKHFDYNFKITMAGHGGVGKSFIIYYFIKGEKSLVDSSTIGV